MVQEPVDSTLVEGLPERFLGKTGMENVESKKELETESQTHSKASLQERNSIMLLKNKSVLRTPKRKG